MENKIEILKDVTAELDAIRAAVEVCRILGSGLLNDIVLRIDTAEKSIADMSDKLNAFFDKHFTQKEK